MAHATFLRPAVLAARGRLGEGRQRLEERHRRGSPGIQVCQALCDLLDQVVLELYEAALAERVEDGPGGVADQVALVAHGGFGRRDVAPYSDVDLMILHAPGVAERIAPLATRLWQDLFDAGLDVGHSVRTTAQACRLALDDAATWTSLVEARLLAGSQPLFDQFVAQFRQATHRRRRRLILDVEAARNDERRQFGETVYLLEPNIKRSQGGLRDGQLLRWIGFARYGTAEPDGLQMRGALLPADARTVRGAWDLLLRIRNEMHFHAGKHADVLDRTEQLRLAEVLGFRGQSGLLPVEEFMREYFRATSGLHQVVSRFVASARPRNRISELFGPLLGHQVERDFVVGPGQIWATRRGLAKLQHDVNEVLRLADLANLYDKRIAHATREAIRRAAPQLPDRLTPATAGRFLSIMSQPARLGELLRFLHEMGVLEKIIPEFAHARCLLQFNEYHRYTVDEHSIRAVEHCAELAADRGPVGRAYSRVKNRGLLHLALLIHDLGKGYPRDHSEVGLEIAQRTAQRLFLPQHDAEMLKFLVHKHLLMSHLAFRRDPSDDGLIVRFAAEVGSPEALRMLYVLTAADFSAVGPGVWNNWKAEVLGTLYQRTMLHLAGSDSDTAPLERLAQRKQEVRRRLGARDDPQWFQRQIDALPPAYLQVTPVEQVLADLRQLAVLGPGEVAARGRFLPETQTVEYTVGTREDVTPGIFHRLTGALTAKGLQILSADINTLADALVLDRFFVVDPDFAGAPPASRLASVEQALVASLRAPDGAAPSFRRTWGSTARRTAALSNLPTRVQTDVTTSDRFTIIDVFAADCTGLLYTITRTLYELELSVAVARIGTYLDQVVDVFYVTDRQGRKVDEPVRLAEIENRLLEAIELHSREEAERLAAR